jgi:hypothetical protein
MADRPLPFTLLADDDDPPRPFHTDVREETERATAAMMLALKALSQRAISAIKDVFTLASVGSAFWLFLSIHEPNPYQLVELAMFSLFILAANWIVRRGK